MKKLFLALILANFANATIPENPEENQPIATQLLDQVAPNQDPILTQEEQDLLHQYAEVERCILLSDIIKHVDLSETQSEKAQTLFKKCLENQHYRGIDLQERLEEIGRGNEPKKDAVRKFLGEAATDADLTEFINGFIVKFDNK